MRENRRTCCRIDRYLVPTDFTICNPHALGAHLIPAPELLWRVQNERLMLAHDIESSPQLYARIGGALYLMLIVLGFYGQAIRNRFVVSGNASATAVNIASHEPMWRAGIAAEFLALICATAFAMIYFYLLRPVSKELNLMATFLRCRQFPGDTGHVSNF
jgi:uncharacterized protein DUF4386